MAADSDGLSSGGGRQPAAGLRPDYAAKDRAQGESTVLHNQLQHEDHLHRGAIRTRLQDGIDAHAGMLMPQ
jgi:hypothetical protein